MGDVQPFFTNMRWGAALFLFHFLVCICPVSGKRSLFGNPFVMPCDDNETSTVRIHNTVDVDALAICAPWCSLHDRHGFCMSMQVASVCTRIGSVAKHRAVCVLPCSTENDCVVHHQNLRCMNSLCAFSLAKMLGSGPL